MRIEVDIEAHITVVAWGRQLLDTPLGPWHFTLPRREVALVPEREME